MFKKMAIVAVLVLLLAIALVITAAVFYYVGNNHGFLTGERMTKTKEITLVGKSATNTLTDVETVMVSLPGDRFFSIYVGNAFDKNSISICLQRPLSQDRKHGNLRAVPTSGGALIIFEAPTEDRQTRAASVNSAESPGAEGKMIPNETSEGTR